MSRKISLQSLNSEQLNKICKDLQITILPSRYAFNSLPTYLYLYEIKDQNLYVPFFYGQKYKRPVFPSKKSHFVGTLRKEQKKVKSETISLLNKSGSAMIAAYPGFGKTSISIYIASKIGLKTLIICHRLILIKQWQEAIKKFLPFVKIQVLTAKDEISKENSNIDFYIINAINVVKKPRSFYQTIGLVIVDEAHTIMAEKMCQCMRYLIPRYVLGLSATPYRFDGLNILLDLYFGPDKVLRKLWRKHTVYQINTRIKPEIKLTKIGKIDWGIILKSQSENLQRNELIVRVLQYFPQRIFLVLCKRVAQVTYLVQRLKECGENVTSLVGKEQTFEEKNRILVGTVQKIGLGFDHIRLDSLLLAADVEQYFVQYLGRVFRREDVEPVIFDFVDDHALLYKHYSSRCSVYTEHGGIIKNFFIDFPNFR